MSSVSIVSLILYFFFFNHPAPTEIYTLSLHDALPISDLIKGDVGCVPDAAFRRPARNRVLHTEAGENLQAAIVHRSEEHTSELQSRFDLVCRLLLEKKKIRKSHPQSKMFINYFQLPVI